MSEWQSMDTAPKDGTLVQLKRDSEWTYVGRYIGAGWMTRPWSWHMRPTHWKPLSDPQAEGR